MQRINAINPRGAMPSRLCLVLGLLLGLGPAVHVRAQEAPSAWAGKVMSSRETPGPGAINSGTHAALAIAPHSSLAARSAAGTPGSGRDAVPPADARRDLAPLARAENAHPSMLAQFWENFRHNLFKPLLLFFYAGFVFVLLGVKLEFPDAVYQGLTVYLLIAIGWHGGEELAMLPARTLGGAAGFMVVGFIVNFLIGILAYGVLGWVPSLRKVDRATVAGYYGSDSAGTFVTCLGVLTAAHIAFDAYMPVMLAVMEIPGCLVALYLVSRLRQGGMDALGNMPGERGYDPVAARRVSNETGASHASHESDPEVRAEEEFSLEEEYHRREHDVNGKAKTAGFLSPKLLQEVVLNPGLALLFAGIIIGYISGRQGADVTRADDGFFVNMFHGMLCLFLLEMGMTAARKLRDLKLAGPRFVAFGLLAPNVFATLGIVTAHAYSLLSHTPLALGTYALFAVLCAAASYIAVPAVQRLAIPEASPTLPLAASLGLTFSYNVTTGIPIYMEIAKAVTHAFPG